MKILLAVITVMFLSITNFYCTTNKSGEMKETADEQTPKKEEVAKPQYEFTVTQKGAELGKIVVELFPDVAPKHCENFDNLVKSGFYDGTAFHRVIPGFMIQGGDPNSKNGPKETWGRGDPSQKTVPAEFSNIPHKRGILSTARRGDDINSATSQFFIMVADYPSLDGQYTVFGKVLEGMEVADKIVATPTERPDRPIDKIEMKIKRLK